MVLVWVLILPESVSYRNLKKFFHVEKKSSFIPGGKRLKSQFNNENILTKIVGLDPARPLFRLDKPEERLHFTDAKYVETIQTSQVGFFKPLGTVSFFPNGGGSQPQCGSLDVVSFPEYITPLEIFQSNIKSFFQICSHSSAYKYFARSVILDERLIGYRCKSMNDLIDGKCSGNEGVLGGEPGSTEQ